MHHPPRAIHAMITAEKPLLALWMRAGKLDGNYWFVDSKSARMCGLWIVL